VTIETIEAASTLRRESGARWLGAALDVCHALWRLRCGCGCGFGFGIGNRLASSR